MIETSSKGILRLTTTMVLLVGFFGLLGYAEETQEQQVERLIRELQDADSNVLSIAAGALGNIGEGAVDAVPTLIQALQDQNADVRMYTRRKKELSHYMVRFK